MTYTPRQRARARQDHEARQLIQRGGHDRWRAYLAWKRLRVELYRAVAPTFRTIRRQGAE